MFRLGKEKKGLEKVSRELESLQIKESKQLSQTAEEKKEPIPEFSGPRKARYDFSPEVVDELMRSTFKKRDPGEEALENLLETLRVFGRKRESARDQEEEQ